MPSTPSDRRGAPWGLLVGLLTACAVTLVGILHELGPDVILLRASVAGVVCGVSVALGRVLWQSLGQDA